MRNKKFILHKALLDALYTLIVKRSRLEKNLEELDINAKHITKSIELNTKV